MSRKMEFLLVAILAFAITSIVRSHWSKPQSTVPVDAATVVVPQIGATTSRIVEWTDPPGARVIYPNYVQANRIR